MPDIASLVASIDERLDALNAEISRLQLARRALGKATRDGMPSGARRRSGPSPGQAARARKSVEPETTGDAPRRPAAPSAPQGPPRRPRANGSRPAKSKAQPFTSEQVFHFLCTAASGLVATSIAYQTG